MLESVDFTTLHRDRPRFLPEQEQQNTLNKYLFVIVACAYMLPWTAIGSLVHYFSANYGNEYYVYLNAAFYFVGLPMSYLQRRVDTYHDAMFGSKFTYRRRLWVCMIMLSICLCIAPFCGRIALIAVVMLIGCCTWVSHGTATSMTSMIKMDTSIMQQIGFALPAVYGVIMALALNLSADSVSHNSLIVFYFLSAAFVLPGVLAWFLICRSDLVKDILAQKDNTLGTLVIDTARRQGEYSTTSPLLDTPAAADDDTCSSSNGEHGGGYWRHGGASVDSNMSLPGQLEYAHEREGVAEEAILSINGAASARVGPTCTDHAVGTTEVNHSHGCTSINSSNYWDLGSDEAREDKSHRRREEVVNSSRRLIKAQPHLVRSVMSSEEVSRKIAVHRWTLFFTIFASILQGSFISYTYGCNLYSIEVPAVLFFVRIFADLIGRPIALIYIPQMFKSIDALHIASIIRIVFMLYFFSIIGNILLYPLVYVRSIYCHMSLILFQALFSACSGYFNCLTYEYAAACFDDEWQRVVASQYLNITFQRACSSAVFVAICIIVFCTYMKPLFGLEIVTY